MKHEIVQTEVHFLNGYRLYTCKCACGRRGPTAFTPRGAEGDFYRAHKISPLEEIIKEAGLDRGEK